MSVLIAIAPPITEPAPAKRPLGLSGPDEMVTPPGVTGPIAGGYLFREDVSSDRWKITHSLGTYPAITVQHDLGLVYGEAVWLDLNRVELRWEEPVFGFALLSVETDASGSAKELEAP